MAECAFTPGVGGRSSGEDRPLKRHDSLRYAAGIVGLLLLYYAAGRFGLSLASLYPSASPVWPASGLALAALLVLGVQVWPAVFLGAFLVNLAAAGQVPGYQPTGLPLFCSSSHFLRGAKYSATAEASIWRWPVSASRASGHGFDLPISIIRRRRTPAGPLL